MEMGTQIMNEKGFSGVELSIAVGIICALAAACLYHGNIVVDTGSNGGVSFPFYILFN